MNAIAWSRPGAELQAENTAKAAEVEKVKDVEVQAKELEDKLTILKLLSRLRLRQVKTLDFMQSSIPEKVWLKTVEYESDTTHVEDGHYKFTGNAVADGRAHRIRQAPGRQRLFAWM